MLFYRVSHKHTARGVYHHSSYCFENGLLQSKESRELLLKIGNDHSSKENLTRTPCLENDYLLETNKCGQTRDCIYGFESIESLKNWFTPEEIETLTDLHFHIVVIDVENFRKYSKQMLVPLDHFLTCEVFDIIKLYNI